MTKTKRRSHLGVLMIQKGKEMTSPDPFFAPQFCVSCDVPVEDRGGLSEGVEKKKKRGGPCWKVDEVVRKVAH